MQEQGVTWDIRSMFCESSTADQVLVIFVLAVVVITGLKLLRVWKLARPFSQKMPEDVTSYAELLGRTSQSLARWLQFSFLVEGICVWANLGRIARVWVLEPQHVRAFGWWCSIEQISGGVGIILVVAAIAFLARWHIEKRLETISRVTNSK